MLNLGLRWRVGDGYNIDVWKDAWLLAPYEFKVITKNPNEQQPMLVHSLIDHEERKWRKDALEQLFMHRDVEEILKIPIFPTQTTDQQVWHYTPNGIFSVRSAYHMGTVIPPNLPSFYFIHLLR